MMLFALLKKDFLIVKKYVLIMFIVIVLIPPVMRWRTPEFTGVFGFILSVIFGVFMLLQYVSLKEYQFPKATTLLCATPFSRKAIVSSKYIFCMAIYAICCIVFELETLFMPGLGTSDIKLFAFMFLIVSVFIGIYLPIQYKFGYEKNKVCLWSDYYGFAIYSATAYESGKSKPELPLYVFAIPYLWRYCPYWFCGFSNISIFVYKYLR